MFSCYLHGWSDHADSCPKCYTTTSSSSVDIKLNCEHGRQVGNPCPHCLGIGSASYKDYEKMFEVKQNDWLAVCKENDKLQAELSEARKLIEECITHLAFSSVWKLAEKLTEFLERNEITKA
jgi:hypothetical protein